MKLKTKEQLPFKYFAVKNDNSLDFEEYLIWLNREYDVNFYGDSILSYYGYDGNTNYWRRGGCYDSKDINTFKNNPKVFTAKEFMKMLRKNEILYLEPRLVAKFTNNSELKTYLEIARLNNLTALYSFYDINDKYLCIEKNNLVVSLVCSPDRDEYKFISDTEFVLRLQNTIDKLNKEKMSDNKKIIGYKAPYDMLNGNIKENDIIKPKDDLKNKPGVWYDARRGISDSHFTIPFEIVYRWEPVYESKEVTVSMGEFNLTVKPNGIFHKNEDITTFVKELVECYTKPFLVNYGASIKDITFSRTGCESSETKLTDWINVWNTYRQFK
jgi:hypothetical protein